MSSIKWSLDDWTIWVNSFEARAMNDPFLIRGQESFRVDHTVRQTFLVDFPWFEAI